MDDNIVYTNLSYIRLRKIIGWSGLLLPWSVWLISWSYEPSISDYYYTTSGVLFTSILTLLGAFLISYRGYEKADEKISDNVITWIGGILIIIVAAVPTKYSHEGNCPTPICNHCDCWSYIHFISAACFFIAMGYLSFVNFPRGGKEPIDKDKKLRNIIYKSCAISMWSVIILTGILKLIFHLDQTYTHMIFWMEVILLNLFGISWLVKGETLADFGIQNNKKK